MVTDDERSTNIRLLRLIKHKPYNKRPHYSLKEVIQPHLPVRLPCYDFVPITSHTFGGFFPKIRSPTSGITSFRDVTGGVYKTRERIHGAVADAPLLAIPTSRSRIADSDPN